MRMQEHFQSLNQRFKLIKFLFVVDPIEKLNLKTDSTIEIMNECSKNKIKVYYCETKNLFFSNKKVYADSTLIKINNKVSIKKRIDDKKLTISKNINTASSLKNSFNKLISIKNDSIIEDTNKKILLKKINNKKLELDFFDLILMRKEPPYDLNYHYATMLLEKTKTKVINSPDGLRTANEKLVILNFPSVIPKTIVTKEEKRIIEFVNKHKKAVIKPIHLFGGKCVSILNKNDKSLSKKINKIIDKEKNYAIAQEFMDEVYKGDKRIFLLNGEPLGGIIRIPKKGDFRANMVIGGKPKKYKINDKDKRIIKAIKPYLIKHGLALAGIDVINDKLIEINITCPTGLVQIKELDQKNITKDIVDYLIQEAKSNRHYSIKNKNNDQ